jgi:hypothetical protein
MSSFSRSQHDKIVVGTNDVSQPEGQPDKSPTGTAILNGPVYVGQPSAAPSYDAVLNVGTQPAEQQSINRQPPMSTPLGIKLDGSMEIVGDGRVPNALRISGGQLDKLFVDGDATFTGAVDCGNKGKLASRFSSADGRPKPFDIQHPTKGEGHRLRHACIEGPEVGVYFRGRLKESNVIELPYYWKDLVDENSITVQLQPIGSNQNLVIQEFNNEFIVIAEDSTNTDLITDLSTIDCFYHVYGERKDINPLIVEYEGNSWEDYPDPNFNPNKVDDDKKTYTDPRFAGPPNTITT